MDENKDFQIYSNFGRQLRSQHPLPQKIKLVHSRILKLSQTGADDSYTIIAKLLHSSEELQKSILPLKKATIINPQNMSAHILLINSLLRLGKENECFSSIKKALSISPREPELHKLALMVLGKLNRFDDLLFLYQETAEMIKDKKCALYLYLYSAEILGALNMIPQGLELYKKAFETGAMESEHHVKYAHVLIREGLSEEAVVQFEHVWKLDTTNRFAINNVASLHYELGRVEKALKCLSTS